LDGDVIDITEQYKEKEGTLAERRSFRHAIALIYKLPEPIIPRSEPITIDVQAMITNLKPQNIGSKLLFNVTVSNVLKKEKYFNVSTVVYSLYYNGERGKNILIDRYSLKLAKFKKNIRRYEINPQDYIYKLVPFSIVRISVIISTVQGTVLKRMFDLKIKKPTLIIKPMGRAVVGKLFYVDVQLINPLQVTLTNCMFSVQGIRLNGAQHHVKPVKPFGNVIYRFALVFDQAIKETVVFLFTSNELDQVQGQIRIKVDYN
ncbi:hemocyte protein-glutamine gamma-glutamyltransferase-like protein, partial [Leptotrombidium deliense]